MVLAQQLFIDSRFVIKAFEMCRCDELDEVLIPRAVLREKNQVMIFR